MKISTRTILLVSAAWALVEMGLVAQNWLSARHVLETSIDERGRVLVASFDIARAATELQMSAIASFIGDVDKVRDTLVRAKEALPREGGGTGGRDTEAARRNC